MFSNLSVIIVTWNGDELLQGCLESIRRVCADEIEIIVVDNAACDSTRTIVSRYANAKYVKSETNLGFAGGNNLGLPHCTRKYVVLLNNDTIVHEDSFSPLVDYMERHPRVAVVQGKMRLSAWGDVLDTCGIMMTPFGVGYDPYVMRSTRETKVLSRAVFAGKGAFLAFRRSILERLGGVLFYDHFHCNYEETDFCHRVWLSGNEVHFVDTPPIDHLQSRTISKLNQELVLARTISNTLFSFLTMFEPRLRFGVVSRFLLIQFAVSVYYCCRLRFKGASSFWRALAMTWRKRSLIASTRRRVQACRVASDRDLTPLIMVRPPLSYYYHAFRGTLSRYKPTDKIENVI